MVDRTVESDGIFGDHRTDAVLAAATVEVAASKAWLHDTVSLTVHLLQGMDSIWNIQLASAARVIDQDHNRDSIFVRCRDKSWSLFRIVAVELDQLCSLPELTTQVVHHSILLVHEISTSSPVVYLLLLLVLVSHQFSL